MEWFRTRVGHFPGHSSASYRNCGRCDFLQIGQCVCALLKELGSVVDAFGLSFLGEVLDGRGKLANDRGQSGLVQVETLQGQHGGVVLLLEEFAKVVDQLSEHGPMLVQNDHVRVEGSSGWKCFHRCG